jgi:formylglycine-generating enzyme
VLKKGVLYIVLIISVSACRNYYSHQPDKVSPGQTPPADMVFVPGSSEVPSFYMGFTEECNLNYNIYLQWLQQVFVDYPGVYQKAVPKNRDVSDLMVMNDPYYKYYQNHAAFAYYPVTGITWLQAETYLAWKTDRLNEAILMEAGVHDKKDLIYQTNESNFNTEAYLNLQYDGLVKRDLDDVAPYGTTRKVRVEDGILFAGFRLPTEAEWEYALSLEKQAQINTENYKNPFGKNNGYPYGKNYFTLRWGRMYGLVNDKMAKHGLPYNAQWDSTQFQLPQRLTGPADYQTQGNRIANLDGNVQEWLLDVYTDTPQQLHYNFGEYMARNDFPVAKPEYYNDIEGYLQEKDSLGRLPFRYLFFDGTGQPVKTSRVDFVCFFNRRYDSIYIPVNEAKLTKSIHLNPQTQRNDTFTYYGQYPHSGQVYKDENGNYFKLQYNYYVIRFNDYNHQRVVKGGTWREPDGKSRRPMQQDSASPNVGFRCVMTYTGLPVKPGYKVKWK